MEERNIGFEIKTVSNLMKRKMENDIGSKDNITRNHTYILGFLHHERNRDIFQKDIEKEFQIRRSTATGILNVMEKNRLIQRVPCKEDARQKKIVVTEKGKELHKKSFEQMQNFEKRLKNSLTEKELEEFFNILDKLKECIDEN